MCIYFIFSSLFSLKVLCYQQLYYSIMELYLFINNILNFKLSNLMYLYILFGLVGFPIYIFNISIPNQSYVIKFFFLSKKLWVGLIKFHPYLFYWSVVVVFIKLFFNYRGVFSFYYNMWFILVSGLGFLLGSFWSYSDRVWGYYWVNDPIELIYLLYWFLFILKLHVNTQNNYKHYFKLFFILIFLYFLAIRLKLINTKHSFIKFRGKWFFSHILLLYIYLSNINYLQTLKVIMYKTYVLNLYNYFSLKIITYSLTKIIFIFMLWVYCYTYYNLLFIKIYTTVIHLIFLIFFIFWYLLTFRLYNAFFLWKKKILISDYKLYLNVYYNSYFIYIKKLLSIIYIKVYVLFSYLSFYTIKVYALKKVSFFVFFLFNYMPLLFIFLTFLFGVILIVVFEFNVYKKKKTCI